MGARSTGARRAIQQGVFSTLRAAVGGIDANVPMFDMRTLNDFDIRATL